MPLVLALELGSKGTAVLPWVRAIAKRLQVDITTRLHPLYKEGEYKLVYICDPQIKGSIAVWNTVEVLQRTSRVQANRYSQREQEMKEAGEKKELQPSIYAPKSPLREKPHYWLLSGELGGPQGLECQVCDGRGFNREYNEGVPHQFP